MNIENMKKLLERLQSDRNPVAFDMATWFRHGDDALYNAEEITEVVQTHACGTFACLAGQAAVLAYDEGLGRGDLTVAETAQAWLGLRADEAHELFHGEWEDCDETEAGEPDLDSLTLDMAITEVERLIAEERVE